jgi:pilus assembly protein CpaB
MSASTRIIAAVLLVLAIVLGVLAFFVGRRPVAPPAIAAASAPPAATFPVVIANRPLEAGQSIPGDAVRVVQFPVQPTGALSKVEDVIGHIPRVGIDPGIPLTENSLSAGLPLDLKPGERGIAVPVDEVVGAGNAIQAGDFVDVFVTVRAPLAIPNNPAGGDRSVARLLLAKLRVLAYGTDSLSPAASAQRQQGQPRSQARSAVLAVPVQDANDLILASQTGKLTLALRYPKDNALPDPDLFVAPERIFPSKPNLQADAKAQLDSPENQAFAGFDTGALIGSSDGAPPKGAPRRVIARGPARPVASDYVEIVRGTEIQRRSTANALGAGQ